MGLSSIGMSELMIILLIVMLLFGTKRVKTLGSDLGAAIRGFRKAMEHEESPAGPTGATGAEPSPILPARPHEHAARRTGKG